MMRRTAAFVLAFGGIAVFSALTFAYCSANSGGNASIWTDVPELAIAVELFNAREGSPMVALSWKRNPTEALLAAKDKGGTSALPSIIVGRRLAGAGLRDRLYPLDYFLKRNSISNSFYAGLLEGGVIEGRRVLLPLSFNLPAIAFLRASPASGDGFTLSLADIAAASAAYGKASSGADPRMGFSPRWDAGFLTLALDAGGARFRIGKAAASRAPELVWDAPGLAASLSELSSWSARVNGSAAGEDDFQFKYLFSQPYRRLKEGRTLYAYMDSSELFLVSQEKRAELDFRWFTGGGRVPISDGTAYAGLVRGASGRAAAEAFLSWLFTPEAQRAILERSRDSRAADYSFGVIGGFSSIPSINEEIFPAFYPDLVGHSPPADKLSAPAALPDDWPALRAAVIAPWILEAMSHAAASGELEARISDYRSRGSRQ